MSYRLELEPDDLRDAGRSAGRRGLMVVLVVIAIAAGSAAGLWAAWRVMSHHGASGPVPILRADERPVKVPPVDPGGMEVPDQDMYVLNHERPADSRVEQLLPPPETPLPRPLPAEPTVTEAPPPGAAPFPPVSPAAPAIASTVPTPTPAPAPAPAVAAVPPPAAVPAAAPAAVSAAAAPAMAAPALPAPRPAPPAAAPSGAGYRLQVAAVRTPEAAQQEWTRLKRAHPDLLGSLSAQSARIDLGARGVFYRIEAGPIADGAAAARACDELKLRKVGCILVKP